MESLPLNFRIRFKLVHGETINSHVSRLFMGSGRHSLPMASKLLFKRWPTNGVMPNNIVEYVDAFSPLCGDAITVRDQNTAYNLYCQGLPASKFEPQSERLLAKLPGPICLARLQPLIGATKDAYQQCPECEEERFKEYAFNFSHRREGIDLACICPIHGLPYRAVGEQLLLLEQQFKTKPTSRQLTLGQDFSRRLDYCLATPAAESQYHKDRVAERIQELGWRVPSLLTEVKAIFRGAFSDARLDCIVQTDEFVENALRSISRPNRAVHYGWCVLVSMVLESSDCPTSLKRKTSNAADEPQADPTVEELRRTLEEHKSLQRMADALNMTRSRVETLCRRHNLPVKWREKKLDPNLRAEIKKAIARRMKPDDVCQMFAISQATYYRLLRAWPELISRKQDDQQRHVEKYKKQWAKLLRKHPKKTSTEIRRLNPALWSALYRNAREWLSQHSPVRSSLKPRERKFFPVALAEQIGSSLKIVAESCTQPGLASAFKSAYRLGKRSGLKEHTLKRLEATCVVEKHEETREVFVQKRLHYALSAKVSTKGKLWRVARAASLREKTIQRYLTIHELR